MKIYGDISFFFFNLFLYFYVSKWMNDTKNEDLTKARKRFNIYKLINDLNSINDCGEFATVID